MRIFWMSAALVVAAGCDKTTGDTGLGGADCGVTISDTYPADGANGVYYRSTVEFTLTVADDTAFVATETPGVQSLSEDGLTVRFTPDDGFAPGTTHSVGLDYCGGQPEISFTTTSHGADLAVSLDDLIGQVWSIDLTDARYPAGEGFTEIIGSLFDRNMLLGVVDASSTGLGVRLGIAEGDDVTQDECFRTLDLDDWVALTGPDFSYSASRVSFGAYAADVELMNVEASGTISPDGESVAGFALATEIDVREVAEVLGISSMKDEICDLAENVGTPCLACDTDGTMNCVALVADQAYGVNASVDGLIEVLEADAVAGCK